MDKTINEVFIKLSSKVPYSNPIQLGDDLTVTVQDKTYIFNAVKEEINDLQDGSVNITYILKSVSE